MDLISREAAIKAAVEWLREEDPYISEETLIEALNAVPTATETA